MTAPAWQRYADAGQLPVVVLRDDQGNPTRAQCPACSADTTVRTGRGEPYLSHHGSWRPADRCPGSFMPLRDHPAGCWRRHHGCAVARVGELEAALADALAAYASLAVPAAATAYRWERLLTAEPSTAADGITAAERGER